jgi:hypothetical protein
VRLAQSSPEDVSATGEKEWEGIERTALTYEGQPICQARVKGKRRRFDARETWRDGGSRGQETWALFASGCV